MTVEQSALHLPERYRLASAIREGQRQVKAFTIPGWTEDPNCQIRPFQQRGIAWLYVAHKGLLADPTGLGKTIQALGLLQFLKSRGEPYRAIVFAPNYNSQMQWYGEIRKFTDLLAVPVHGEKAERVSQYATWWDVLVTRYSLLLRDLNYLRQMSFDVIICDEASMFRHHNTKTAHYIKALTHGSREAPGAERVAFLDATPIQTSLLDLHSIFEAFQLNVFGALPAFENRYVRREPVKIRRGNSWVPTTKIVGYRNMGEFKEKIAPLILRRKLSEVEAEMPDVTAEDVWLELPPSQRRYYEQARKGMITLWQSAVQEVVRERDPMSGKPRVTESYVTVGDKAITLSERSRRIRASFHHLLLACDSSYAIDGKTDESVKLDWLITHLKGDFAGQKVIVFSKYKLPIAHAMLRFQQHGISAVRFTGDEDASTERQENYDAFWRDDGPQVLIGTSALERSLNLQKSAYMIALSQLWNPQRMEQLLGRIRRLGSPHARVFLINLITENTIEERLQRLLKQRAALPDFVFGEESEIFEKLSDQELMAMIQE